MGAMAVDVRKRAAAGTGYDGLPRPSGPGGWSIADLELLPDDGLRYELIDGTLLVSPAPTPRHQVVLGELIAVLRDACPREYRVLFAPLDWQPGGARSFEPDLLVLRRSDIAMDRLTGAPLLLAEVLSPSTAAIDRTVKFSAYAEGGVAQYWIVDPGTADDGSDCAVEVYDLTDGAYVLQVKTVGNDAIAVDGPVPVRLVPAELVR